jgi:serine/threonine protein kinase
MMALGMATAFQIGNYEVLRKIAEGGMGTVYAAMLRGADGFSRVVAIKRLHPFLELGDDALLDFADEARIGARLSHPNLVEVLGFERLGDTYCIVMEYVHGCNLASLVRSIQKPLSAPEAALIICGVLSGLEVLHGFRTKAHKRPLVHRDISPRNILLSEWGQVKLADLGLVLVIGKLTAATDSRVRGTVAYMSPEQASGAQLDGRSDLFSAGLVLYEMLTGREAYAGDDERAILRRVKQGLAGRSEAIGSLDEQLQQILRRALEPDPAARYQDAASFRADLEQYLQRSGRPSQEDLAARVRPLAGSINSLLEMDQKQGRVTQVVLDTGETAAPIEPAKPRRQLRIWITSAVLLILAAGALIVWIALG